MSTRKAGFYIVFTSLNLYSGCLFVKHFEDGFLKTKTTQQSSYFPSSVFLKLNPNSVASVKFRARRLFQRTESKEMMYCLFSASAKKNEEPRFITQYLSISIKISVPIFIQSCQVLSSALDQFNCELRTSSRDCLLLKPLV